MMKMEGFENDFKSGAFWKRIVFETLFLVAFLECGTEKKVPIDVVSISVLSHVNVDSRWKCIKKYMLLNVNKLFCGQVKTKMKTLVWSWIFCFILVEMIKMC